MYIDFNLLVLLGLALVFLSCGCYQQLKQIEELKERLTRLFYRSSEDLDDAWIDFDKKIDFKKFKK